MTARSDAPGSQRHVLLYECRTQGHHLPWLRMIAEDLLDGGVRVSLAVPQHTEAQRRLHEQLGELSSRLPVFSITTSPTEPSVGRQLRRAAELQRTSGADTVFFCCWDEVASACLRRAAVGWMPPATLRGRLGGVFFRPRFLHPQARSLNSWLKGIGFRRLTRGHWFRQLLFLDELLLERALSQMPDAPFGWLPDPPTQVFDLPQSEARAALGLPPDKTVLLFYGGPYRRKGLHVVLQAMAQLPPDHPAFLLCAGLVPAEREILAGLRQLTSRGRALVLNRYVSAQEEKVCFGAADVVLLPYVKHFGSSGVLAQAAAAGKPVIASDQGLIAHRVRQYGLGWLFRAGDAQALRQTIEQVTAAPEADWQTKRRAAGAYAAAFSRAEFRRRLLAALS